MCSSTNRAIFASTHKPHIECDGSCFVSLWLSGNYSFSLADVQLATAQVKELMNMGYDYARRMDAAGRLDPHFGIAARPEHQQRQEHQHRQEYRPQPAAAAA